MEKEVKFFQICTGQCPNGEGHDLYGLDGQGRIWILKDTSKWEKDLLTYDSLANY